MIFLKSIQPIRRFHHLTIVCYGKINILFNIKNKFHPSTDTSKVCKVGKVLSNALVKSVIEASSLISLLKKKLYLNNTTKDSPQMNF